MYLGIDTETTGLPHEDPVVLEIAVAVIGPAPTFEVVYQATSLLPVGDVEAQYNRASPFVQEMHTKNNLWADLVEHQPTKEEFSVWLATVQADVSQWGIGVRAKVPIFGSTPSFDRRVLEGSPAAHILNLLTHQHLDVSTLTLCAKDIGVVPPKTETAHRASDDLLWSVSAARFCLAP